MVPSWPTAVICRSNDAGSVHSGSPRRDSFVGRPDRERAIALRRDSFVSIRRGAEPNVLADLMGEPCELSLRRVVAETATIQRYEADVALRSWAYSSHPQRPKINTHPSPRREILRRTYSRVKPGAVLMTTIGASLIITGDVTSRERTV